jgi:hypothetical protein
MLNATLFRVGWEIVHRESEVSEYFVHRNAFPAALPERSLRTINCMSLFLGQWLIIHRGGRYRQRSRIEQHEFQESDRGGNLGGFQTLYQLMGLPFFICGVVRHKNSLRAAQAQDRIAPTHYSLIMLKNGSL